jgi:small-conductance mechanosensitive channel
VHILKKEQIGGLRGVLTSITSQIGHFFTAHGKWFNESLFKIGNIPVTPLGLLKVVLIIFIAFLFGKFLKSYIHKFGVKHQLMRNSSLYILSRLVYYLILVIGFIIAGASLGFDLTAFAYIAGAITVWIGFGLQSIFMNFISGIIILLTKTLNVGDIIVLDSGEVGQIDEINLRTTILATADGIEVIVPNSELVTKKFINRTLAKNSRRINVAFRLPIGVDKALIKKVLVEAVLKEPNTLPQPQPELWVIGYGENFLNCEMAIWVNEYLSPLSNMSTNAYYFNVIDDVLRANNIEIPIVHLHYPH